MTTEVIEKRFPIQVGDQVVELPGRTRDEALRNAGLNPRHWPEAPTKQRQVNTGKPKARNKSIHTPQPVKKHTIKLKTTKKSGNGKKPVTLTGKNVTLKRKNVTHSVTHKQNGNAKCSNCGQLYMSLRPWSKYCSLKCRIADFRKRNKS